MNRLYRVLPIASILLLAALVLVFVVDRAATGQTARVIAVPEEVDERAVLGVLAEAGLTRTISASAIQLPLSDFSRVVLVPFAEARLRALEGDPRRTPLFDDLERRFFVKSPDDAIWRLLYVLTSSGKADETIVAAVSGLGVNWAWDAKPGRSAPALVWLPAVLWAVYLVLRKPGYTWIDGGINAIAWLPVLGGASVEAAALVVVLEAAGAVAIPVLRSGWPRRLPAMLWPYVVASLALLALDTGLLPYLAVSVALAPILVRTVSPALEKARTRRWLHPAPVFKPITQRGSMQEARSILLVVSVPVMAILMLSLVLPARPGNTQFSAQPLHLERGTLPSDTEPEALLSEHIAFQYAITYGRLGEAVWGGTTYNEAYRYAETSGRVERIPGGDGASIADVDRVRAHDLVDVLFILNEAAAVGIAGNPVHYDGVQDAAALQ
ncbi:MAG: hypothetical protein JXM71_02680 [Spirochaetales bacterium]|nr:hypothetical protein [Spirochaetales bacterium]